MIENMVKSICNPFTYPAIVLAVSIYALTATYSDIKSLRIRDDVNFAMIIFGIGFNSFFSTGTGGALSAIAGFLTLLIPAVIVGAQMGGDIKFFTGLGAWLGIDALIPILLIAVIVFVTYAALTGAKKREAMPFAPFLSAGIAVTMMICGFILRDNFLKTTSATLLLAVIIIAVSLLSDKQRYVRRGLLIHEK